MTDYAMSTLYGPVIDGGYDHAGRTLIPLWPDEDSALDELPLASVRSYPLMTPRDPSVPVFAKGDRVYCAVFVGKDGKIAGASAWYGSVAETLDPELDMANLSAVVFAQGVILAGKGAAPC